MSVKMKVKLNFSSHMSDTCKCVTHSKKKSRMSDMILCVIISNIGQSYALTSIKDEENEVFRYGFLQ